MIPQTNVLYETTAPVDGAASGDTFTVPPTARPGGDYIPAQATFVAGTGTVVFEGRNGPGDGWVHLWETTESDGRAVMRMNQMRARVADAADFVGRATLGAMVRRV